ncbi:hypothetical protein M409DRAFT_16430 [Zasmidium cellare ATCC 36951]|uniref:FAD-binding PCMH-type domain-containing protein n=1 Tax=Zasmidium cellare ATCC 36951 TaxID=1080233 RepID=A0A6A6D7E7_ZASCE|nr:uncharacterized protein M409DRAFT_16430 [Zasmidium cellare ATCC 36951]KAF2174162.1 hypothetical protein M409DRAFT_16430 [Zasmidium cellare ATCC 36951]
MSFVSALSLASAFLAIIPTVVAASSAKTACSLIEKQYPKQYADSVLELSDLALGVTYTDQLHAYWSQANADNIPACMFFPKTAQDIAFAVQVLNNYTDVPFAVKGGGHNPNKGFSSTKDGILIATEPNMATTTLDSNNYAHIGPGSRWIDVATALDPYNRAVVSGRLGHVGAAGLTLGGGLSFLSTEHGMTADTVVEYEIVTAQGEVTRANKNQNSDIWYALKGGGNQFAIVTEFVLETFPIGQVWGGHKIYTLDQKDALINATHNLISNYYDTKAAVIVTFSTTLDSLVDIFVVFFYYNSPAGPGPILSEFNAIPSLIDATKGPRSYKDLIDDNSQFSLDGMRYLIRTGTFPNLPGADGVDLYQNIFNSWFDLAKSYQRKQLDNYVFSLAYQPMPYTLQSASVNAPNGVNLLGLDPAHGDKVFMEYDVSWLLPTTDAAAAADLTNITQPAQNYARQKYGNSRPTHWSSGYVGTTNFNPLFMNDAMYNQDPVRSYGEETYERLRGIQRQRDPSGLFSGRTGGWKFT